MQKKYILWLVLANIALTMGLFLYQEPKQNSVNSTDSINTEYTTLQNSLHSAAETTLPAVVGVFSDQQTAYGIESKKWTQEIQSATEKYIWWSAFFIDSKWYLLTSKHVVQDNSKTYFVILQDKRTFKVTNIWMDPNLDLAVLYIQQDNSKNQISFPVATIQNGQTGIRAGQLALTIGTPFSQYANTVSLWIVSAIDRTLSLDGGQAYSWLYQLDINTNPGNSGGPLITPQWEVFGLVTAMSAQSSHIGFAIPISQKLVLQVLASSKEANKTK